MALDRLGQVLGEFDVSDVALVPRAFPIRVAGDSGPFGSEEIDWTTLAAEAGCEEELTEHTSVTGRPRQSALAA